jgi:hypothetical protein
MIDELREHLLQEEHQKTLNRLNQIMLKKQLEEEEKFKKKIGKKQKSIITPSLVRENSFISPLVRENSFISPLVRENSSDYYDINDKDSFANSLKRFQDPKEHRAFIEEYENTPSYKDALSRIQNRHKWSPFTGNTSDYELNSLRKVVEDIQNRHKWSPFTGNTSDYELNSLRKVVEDIHNSKSGGKKKISRRKKRKMRKTHKKIHSNKNRK